MDEADFWGHLEYRLCRELRTLEDCRRLGLWCDGFIPEGYVLDAPAPEIHGRVWIGLGPRQQEQWTFRVALARPAAAREAIAWATLCPANDVTNWLRVDIEAQHLDIDPALAER